MTATLVSNPRITYGAIAAVNRSADAIQDKHLARTLALANQDVLREIFYHLKSNSDDLVALENKTALFRAALTCKAFMEPALDSLWWSISSFMPLLRLLQNFQEDQDVRNSTFAFCDSFSEEDWTRFDCHSKRVREFHCHTALTEEIDMTALFHLGQCRPAIFPNLREVTWTAPLSPLIVFLVSSGLKYLDIETDKNDDSTIIMTLISALSHRAPSLTDITLRGVLSKSCLALVPKIASLVTIVVPDLGTSVSMTFLHRLGAMTHLQDLDIDFDDPDIVPIMFPDHLGFPELRTLHISGPPSLIHKFITGIVSEQMTSALISSHSESDGTLAGTTPTDPDTQDAPDILEILRFIGNHWHHLACLDIDLPNMSPKYPDATSFTLFQPLRNCHSLMSISINAFMPPPSPDQAIADIGNLWPAIQTLKIPFSPLPEAIDPPADTTVASPQHTPTIFGLRLLAQRCPHLKTLQLSLDTSSLPEATGEPLSHGSQVLSVGDSEIKDAFLVAAHLDCLFPCLRTIRAADSDSAAPNGWGMVEKILRICQASRSSDRKRTALGKAKSIPPN